jgi:predicted nucleic acid-binding protein
MSAPEFLDSNILVYAYDDTDPRKKGIAQDFVKRAILGEFVASTQSLAELATTLLHKFSPPFRAKEVLAILDALSPIKLVLPDGGIIRRAVEARETHGLHFFDGMIVAAAERVGCERIWSEDLNAGQKYFGVRVQNPFSE